MSDEIVLTVEDLEDLFHSDLSPEELKARRLVYVRSEIRESLKILNALSDEDRTISDGSWHLDLSEDQHGDHFVIRVWTHDRHMLVECMMYGLSRYVCRGLTVRTGTQEIVFEERGEEQLNYASAYFPDWDGNRGPMTFELRDLD